MKKIIAVLLAVVTCLGFSACGEQQPGIIENRTVAAQVGQSVALSVSDEYEKEDVVWKSSDNAVATVYDGVVTGVSEGSATITAESSSGKSSCNVEITQNHNKTTHVYAVGETPYALVENGATEYRIVYSASETDELIYKVAVEELQYFFEQATGIRLKAVSDRNLVYSPNAKYLSIGENALSRGAGIAVDRARLGQNGLQVITRGRTVFMLGGGRFGTLYAVYEFLKWQFHYEQFAVDEYRLDRNVTDARLLHFAVTDIPDFEWRMGNYGEYWFGDLFPKRMRMHRTEDIWIQLGGLPWHNFKATISPSQHQATHPEWFSPDGVQLCLSRDVEGLSDEVVAQMKKYIEANPHLSNLTFTQEDVNVWCTCASCRALKAKYGVNSASNIKFINVVAGKLKAWLSEAHPDRDITVVIFAYHQVEDAPATLNAQTGAYEPLDDTVVLRDNVAVMYAPIFANHYYDYDVTENERVVTTMKKWQALTDQIYLWSYSTYFVNYLMPFDAFNAMQKKYIFAYENNVKYLFDQGQYNQNVGTDWYRLKEYLSSKMSWDIHQDMDALIDEFFTAYYKDAAPAMMKYFKAYRTYFAYLAEAYGVGGTIGESISHRRYWPQRLLREWLGYIDEAYAAVEGLKDTDPELYQTLRDRLCIETISIRHLDLTLYEDTYAPGEYRRLYTSFKDDCARLGVNNYNEWNAIGQQFGKY